MGVPAFFKWLSTKYPKVVVDVLEEHQQWVDGQRQPVDTSQPNPNGIEFDNLFLDMNGIIHPASHPEDRPAPKTEDDMYLCIAEYLERVFACVRPRKLLFMAIDGVAPRAKMNQQRSRRFKSDQERREAARVEAEVRAEWEQEGRELPEQAEPFDSNVITPGTPFMDGLATFLRAFVCHKQSTDAGWRHIRVILSDASVPGEGEHKIMEYIRQQRAQPGYDACTHHALHGLDADLIMLALATHEPYFTIVREYVGKGNRQPPKRGADALEAQVAAQRRGEFGDGGGGGGGGGAPGAPGGSEPAPTPFQFLHVYVLREYLHKEFYEARFCAPDQFDLERFIDDFIFLCFFVGNDFLPHVPSLEIREGAIDTLLELYKALFARPGGGFLCRGAEVDLRRVKQLTCEIAALEPELLRRRRENEQREEARRQQRKVEVAQRTAEQRHLSLLGEIAQTPQQMAELAAAAGTASGAPPPTKRARSAGGAPMAAAGSSDDGLLLVLDRIKEYADSDADEPLELPASLSGYERRMAHQYCDELGLDHPTIGSDPYRRIVLKKRQPRAGDGASAASQRTTSASDFKEKLKSILRENAEVAEPTDTVELGRDGWRERYYSQKLGEGWEGSVGEMCRAYVEGLCWVMAYYYDGCASWHWFYPFHYAPFATDLASAVDMAEMDVRFELGEPFRPFEQLMGVLPPGSAHALPRAMAELMVDKTSALAHIYPLQFDSDMNGKKFAWQAVVLLPFIDQEELLSAARAVEHTLTPEERRRNSVGETLVFVSEHHPLSKPLTQLQQEARAQGGADAPAAAPSGGAAARRVQLSMKLSRGMGGAIYALAHAPMIGEVCAAPPFRGERQADRLRDFETRATYGGYALPPHAPHKPVLLPGVQLPRPTLSSYDMPSSTKFLRPRRIGGPQQLSAAQREALLPAAPPRPVPMGAGLGLANLGAGRGGRGGGALGILPAPPPMPPMPGRLPHPHQSPPPSAHPAGCGGSAAPPAGSLAARYALPMPAAPAARSQAGGAPRSALPLPPPNRPPAGGQRAPPAPPIPPLGPAPASAYARAGRGGAAASAGAGSLLPPPHARPPSAPAGARLLPPPTNAAKPAGAQGAGVAKPAAATSAANQAAAALLREQLMKKS